MTDSSPYVLDGLISELGEAPDTTQVSVPLGLLRAVRDVHVDGLHLANNVRLLIEKLEANPDLLMASEPVGPSYEDFAVVHAAQLAMLCQILSHARLLLATSRGVPTPEGFAETLMLLAMGLPPANPSVSDFREVLDSQADSDYVLGAVGYLDDGVCIARLEDLDAAGKIIHRLLVKMGHELPEGPVPMAFVEEVLAQ